VGGRAIPAYDAAPNEALRERATALAEGAAAILLAEEEHVPTGSNWLFVAPRFRPDYTQMPNSRTASRASRQPWRWPAPSWTVPT
jgi:hypothetical protein